MSSAEALSLEETNKTRIALGLAPLADPTANDGSEVAIAPSAEEIAVENYRREKAAQDAEKRANEAQEREDKARNQRELKAKLAGKGLGEADGAEDDVKSWVKKSKKKAKSIAADLAKRRAAEQAELDAELQARYDESDLAGLKVGHSMEEFDDGEETVLTLKDSRIGQGEEDDELVNVSLAEKARNEERLRLAREGKKAGKYNPYADDDAEFTAPGKKRGILSKYDADIPGGADNDSGEGFTLGAVSRPSTEQEEAVAFQAVDKPVEKTAEARKQVAQQLGQSLDLSYEKTLGNSDYLQEGDVGFRKSKKKSKKSKKEGGSRRRALDDDEAMQEDEPAQPRTSAAELEEQVMMDDEGLQAALARQRREKSRKNASALKRLAEEQLQQASASSRNSPMHVEGTESPSGELVKQEEIDDDEGGLILDDTSEFVRNINKPAPVQQPKPAKRENATPAPVPEREPSVKLEEGEAPDEDTIMEAASADGAAVVKNESPEPDRTKDDDAYGGTSAELYVSSGLANTVKLMKQQGLVKERTAEDIARDEAFKRQQAFIASRRQDEQAVLAQQAARRAQGHAGNHKGGMNAEQRQREQENKQRERELAWREQERMKTYNPTFELQYKDEFGREMSQKESWKFLSHRFHGKGSGTKKKEKRLKAIEDERMQERMASGDTPLNSMAAFQARQERLGSATMILSVGNKATAPSLEDFQTSTGGVEISKQPKAGSSRKQQPGSRIEGLNLTPTLDNGASGSVTPMDGTASASAPKRAGFRRVGKREAEESPAPESDSKRPRQEDA